MAKIEQVKNKKHEIIHPITEESAVLTADGGTLSEKLSDLDVIRDNAALGSTAYRKPSSGIPQSDFDQITRDILANVVLFGEEVGTV